MWELLQPAITAVRNVRVILQHVNCNNATCNVQQATTSFVRHETCNVQRSTSQMQQRYAHAAKTYNVHWHPLCDTRRSTRRGGEGRCVWVGRAWIVTVCATAHANPHSPAAMCGRSIGSRSPCWQAHAKRAQLTPATEAAAHRKRAASGGTLRGGGRGRAVPRDGCAVASQQCQAWESLRESVPWARP
jgi:hypothetical protein